MSKKQIKRLDTVSKNLFKNELDIKYRSRERKNLEEQLQKYLVKHEDWVQFLISKGLRLFSEDAQSNFKGDVPEMISAVESARVFVQFNIDSEFWVDDPEIAIGLEWDEPRFNDTDCEEDQKSTMTGWFKMSELLKIDEIGAHENETSETLENMKFSDPIATVFYRQCYPIWHSMYGIKEYTINKEESNESD